MPKTLWRSIMSAWLLLWPILHSRRPRRSRNCRLSKSSCKFTFKINCRSRDRRTRINSSCRIHNIGLSSVAIRIRSNLSTFMHVRPPTREFCSYNNIRRRNRQTDYYVARIAFLDDEFEHVSLRDRTFLRSERFLKSRTIIMRMFHNEKNFTRINIMKARNRVSIA